MKDKEDLRLDTKLTPNNLHIGIVLYKSKVIDHTTEGLPVRLYILHQNLRSFGSYWWKELLCVLRFLVCNSAMVTCSSLLRNIRHWNKRSIKFVRNDLKLTPCQNIYINILIRIANSPDLI